jgi:hypothetical protein
MTFDQNFGADDQDSQGRMVADVTAIGDEKARGSRRS